MKKLDHCRLFAGSDPVFSDKIVRWSFGIFNSFDCLQMSAFTEKASSKVKVLKRSAHSHRNFQHFRNRIVHIFNTSMQKGAA
ncbi:MAG: transposase [Ruminococcaceae bacterium]|nr:transposase [Oscillospiraceae bacterium]MBS5781586.1 transposase [Clostridium sp.]